MTRKVRRLLILALIVLVAAAIAFGLSVYSRKTLSRPNDLSQTEVQEISVTVEIIDGEGEKTTLNLKTDKTYLAEALVQEGVIEYADDGLYTTVNGITADYNKDRAWWCVTKDGTMINEGMNTLKLADGDKYEITYTK